MPNIKGDQMRASEGRKRPLCERPIRYNKCTRTQQHADARAPAARRHYGDMWRRWAHRCRMRGGRTKHIRQQTTHGGSLQLPSSARCQSDVLILACLPRRHESRECGRHRGPRGLGLSWCQCRQECEGGAWLSWYALAQYIRICARPPARPHSSS